MNYNIQLRTIPYYFVFNVEASQSGELSWSSKAMRRAPRLNVTYCYSYCTTTIMRFQKSIRLHFA